MPAFSFRFKLLLAMMSMVVGVTGTTLYITQNKVQETYRRSFEQQFHRQFEFFNKLQETRLNSVKERCASLAKLVRLRSAMRRINSDVESKDQEDLAETVKLLYQTARDELREIRDFAQAEELTEKSPFLCFLDGTGQPHFGGKAIEAMAQRKHGRGNARPAFPDLNKALTNDAPQQVGFITTDFRDQQQLREMVLTKIQTEDGEMLGALVLGFPVAFSQDTNSPPSGIWFDGEIFSRAILDNLREPLAQKIARQIGSGNREGEFPFAGANETYRVYYEEMNRGSGLQPAYQVCVMSMSEALREQKNLQGRILGFGVIGLFGALAVGLLLSHGLSEPIRQLVKGTEEIQKGNFAVKVPVRSRDEIGRLAGSFNEMAEGLAQKEKYRAVLNMVADKNVAQEMIDGKIALGGEVREVSVLFCDIRGFTALTRDMPPAEVIQMLNEHMTALTRVVYEHGGVVDKFVGDLIMAIFGAPKPTGQDAWNAARCALDMTRDREKLNESSQHKIRMGIGVATGEVVAGCMGSLDRLNYTVLGERVNLASRLCSQAGAGEVVIDQKTKERLDAVVTVQPLPEMKLKGYSAPVQAYKLIEVRPLSQNA